MSVLEVVFLGFLVVSVFLNFLSIPGNFAIVLNSGWYGIVTDFNDFSMSFVLVLLAIALGVELLEYFVIAFGARRYGASRIGTLAGIVGGIVGSVSGFLFSPVLGAIIYGFLGVIVGTLLIEVLRGKNIREALKSAYGAILGRIGGLTIKAIGSVAMLVIIANKIL